MVFQPSIQLFESVSVEDDILLLIEIVVVVLVQTLYHVVGCGIRVRLTIDAEHLPTFQERLGEATNYLLAEFAVPTDHDQ